MLIAGLGQLCGMEGWGGRAVRVGGVQQSPTATPRLTPAAHKGTAICKLHSPHPATGEMVLLGLGRNATHSSLFNLVLVLGCAAKLYNAGEKDYTAS